MAKMDKTIGYYFILPQDVKVEGPTIEHKMAVSNILKLHKLVYGIDLMKETDQFNFYGKQLPYKIL